MTSKEKPLQGRARPPAKAGPATPPTIQDNLVSSLVLTLKRTESLFRQVLPVVETMRDNTAAMIHTLHEQQRTEEYRRQQRKKEEEIRQERQEDAQQQRQEKEEDRRRILAEHKHAEAESRLLEWLRKNAPEQLDPTGSTHLYDICLRIAAEWCRLRAEKH